MSGNHLFRRGRAARDAADWYVALDRCSGDAKTEAAFSDWLETDSAHAAAFARCQAAAILADKLRYDNRAAWVFDEVRKLSRRAPQIKTRSRLRWLYQDPRLAWGVAACSVIVAVLALVSGGHSEPATRMASVSAHDMTASSIPGFTAVDRVAVLPGQVIVDIGSVAILPFAGEQSDSERTGGQDSRALATSLYEQVLRQLESIPGVYVIGSGPLEPYLGSEIPPEEMAALLGVRGIVQGSVRSAEGRVSILLSMTDAANRGRRVEGTIVGPLTELDTMRSDIAKNIVLALSEPVIGAQ